MNGRAPLTYDRISPAVKLEVRGALAPVGSSDEVITGTPVQADADGLTSLPPDPRGRPIIAPPLYGAAWVANPKATAWGGGPTGGLNNDPRHRGVAGLGAHVGIVEQDTIVDAVRDHAGSIDVAAQRISQLSMGLAPRPGSGTSVCRRPPSTAC
jgi:hypothetical protein